MLQNQMFITSDINSFINAMHHTSSLNINTFQNVIYRIFKTLDINPFINAMHHHTPNLNMFENVMYRNVYN